MAEIAIIKEYAVLKDKYGLPELSKLDKEFDLSVIDFGTSILKDIRARMMEKFASCEKILEGILQPGTSLVDIVECKAFDDDGKSKLFDLYRELMLIDRTSIELDLRCEEKLDADFIKHVYSIWPDIKKKMVNVTKALKDTWAKDTDSKEVISYFG